MARSSMTFSYRRTLSVVAAEKVGLFILLLTVMLSERAKAQILGVNATSLCAELISPLNYTCIEYQAKTGDGFILGIQNIPFPRGMSTANSSNVSRNRPVVVLQHGVLAAGDNFVLNSPIESLAFALADAGYNVWIANNRNVQWSHGHTTFVPSDPGYWNWTSDELSSYDLQASVRFVYNQTGRNKIFYIGHSQGTLMILAGLTGGAFKNEILGYLRGVVMLAPVAFVGHITAPIPRAGLELSADVLINTMNGGVPKEFDAKQFASLTCILSTLCTVTLDTLLGPASYINQSRVQLYSTYYPQPTSTFNINHFGQALRTNTFQFYDRGSAAANQAAYGQSTPPPYNLTQFPSSLPLQLWTGGIDGLADQVDVQNLLSQLPSQNRTVNNLPSYGHIDFVYGDRAYLDIFPDIIAFIKMH